MDGKMFPLQAARRNYPRAAAPLSIPWSVAVKAVMELAAVVQNLAKSVKQLIGEPNHEQPQ